MKGFEFKYEEILHQFIRNTNVKTVLELGVCTGVSTRAILKALGEEGQMWSVDIYTHGEHQKIKAEYPRWDLTICDDLEVEWNREVDLIFIDTLHHYDQALAELDKFSPFARHWIFLHDTKSCPQVLDAIQAFLMTDDRWIFGEWSHRYGLAILMRRPKDEGSNGA